VILTTAWGKNRSKRFHREEKLNRVVLSFDLATGELLWKRIVFTTDQEKRHPLNTPAAATPAADGERIYVFFGMGLAALDYDGNVVWSTEVDPHYIERARYGVVSSPIVVGDKVIIARDDEWGGDEVHDISWIAAYDKDTGRELWRHENDETCCSYAPPIVRATSSGDEIVFPSTPFVAAYSVDTGERLWSAEHTARQVVPTALLADDLLVLPGSIHQRSIFVWRLTGEGPDTEAEWLWGGARSAPKIPSPLIVEGRLFVATDKGVLAIFDPASGKQVATRRLARGNYHSSLVSGDGKLYITSDSCLTSVVSTTGKFKTIAENQINGRCEASPAITESALVIRTIDELYCIEKFEREGEPEGDAEGEPKKKKKKKRKKQQAESEEEA
jgi:outer membrane protein assembly factor BamB